MTKDQVIAALVIAIEESVHVLNSLKTKVPADKEQLDIFVEQLQQVILYSKYSYEESEESYEDMLRGKQWN